MRFRLGTRGSQLALAQTKLLESSIIDAYPDAEVETVVVTTTGDINSGKKTLDKRDWITELESALLDETIDIAVHSAKDVPVDVHPRTEVSSALTRANPLDVFVSNGGEKSLVDFVEGAVIGTSSLRRQKQINLIRPDLKVESLRGNVPTRIKKCLEENVCHAMVIAKAGVERLGLQSQISFEVPAEHILPACCQGTIAIQYREGERPRNLKRDPYTQKAFEYERAVVQALGADCSSALGVLFSEKQELTARCCGTGLVQHKAECITYEDLERFIEQLLKKGGKEALRNNY